MRPGDIIILLSPRPVKGFTAVVDEVTSDGCTAHMLDAESEPRHYGSDQFMPTKQTTTSLTLKYERTASELDEALTLERSVPEFFSQKTKKKKGGKKKKTKKLTAAQLKLLAQIIKEKSNEKNTENGGIEK